MSIKKLIILIVMLIKKINNTNTNANVDKKINNTNDEDFIENIRDLFNNKLDKKINNTNVDKKLIILMMKIL